MHESYNVDDRDDLLHLDSTAHNDHIYQLSWRPTDDASQLQLASCSEDGTVKIFIV
jgi:WD40 repeat protein